MRDNIRESKQVATCSRRPLISVGVPVYNDARFIGAALQDIAAQTFRDFEVIISDNASTDGTSEICRDFVEAHGFVRYIRQATNIGAQRNFQATLDEARGRYFVWVASDDRRSTEFLEVLVGELEKDPANVSAFCTFVNIDSDGNVLEKFDFDFSSVFALIRVARFTFERNRRKDVMIYGLHRTDVLRKAGFTRWWAPNRNVILRTAYPTAAFLLASGRYSHVNSVLFRSQQDSASRDRLHYGPNAHSIWHRLALVNLLEVNVHYAILRVIRRATGSLWVFLAACPLVLAALLYNVALDNIGKARRHLLRLVHVTTAPAEVDK